MAAITSIPQPHDVKTLIRLQGKIQIIKRLIAQLSYTFRPFNELLKKDAHFEWDESYQQSFNHINQYLLNPLVLIHPKDGFPFYLYLSAMNFILGVMLIQNNEQAKEQAIYYLNRTPMVCELKYVYIDKVCLEIIFANNKLKHYILNHTTYMIFRADPLKYMMRKVDHNTDTTKCIMFLSKLDLVFISQRLGYRKSVS